MSRHAPGPWRAGNWGQSIVSDTPIQGGINGSDAVESYGGHLIAESISECNRPLIIAAPELLEALEGMLYVREQEKIHGGPSEYHDGIRALIAKARGEA